MEPGQKKDCLFINKLMSCMFTLDTLIVSTLSGREGNNRAHGTPARKENKQINPEKVLFMKGEFQIVDHP